MFYVSHNICRQSDIEKELDNKCPMFTKNCSKDTWYLIVSVVCLFVSYNGTRGGFPGITV